MVRTSNSCSSCTTVVGEYVFVNKLTGRSVLLLQSSEIGSVCGLNPSVVVPGLFLYVVPLP